MAWVQRASRQSGKETIGDHLSTRAVVSHVGVQLWLAVRPVGLDQPRSPRTQRELEHREL